MKHIDIVEDLHRTLADIATMIAVTSDCTTLEQVAALLAGFVDRHRADLNLGSFPLPAGADGALCHYELHSDDATGLALYLNSICGGVDSVVHDHGSWAVIVAIEGEERNRIYRRAENGQAADRPSVELEREVVVREGQPLILEEGMFHSIHTASGQPALQLHLYGKPVDSLVGRRFLDPKTGKLAGPGDGGT